MTTLTRAALTLALALATAGCKLQEHSPEDVLRNAPVSTLTTPPAVYDPLNPNGPLNPLNPLG